MMAGAASEVSEDDKLHVVVVVLGDLGRSPRMQYHCLSLLQAGHTVTFVGYTGEDLVPALQAKKYKKRFQVVRFIAPKLYHLKDYFLMVYLVWRILSLTILLVLALFRVLQLVKSKALRWPDVVLVQNPPAVPLLAAAAVYCRLLGAAFVIDWHNLGFSMIPGPQNGAIKSLAKQYEKWWAPYAHGHLTVTKALRDYLVSDIGITQNTNINVLHDCPPPLFRLRTIQEQHAVLKTLNLTVEKWNDVLPVDDKRTLFTEEYAPGKIRARPNRPALICSSTSWTRDEDIGLLIDACVLVDNLIEAKFRHDEPASNLRFVCAITGKGPLREIYQQDILAKCASLKHVHVCTLWIPPPEYPVWLGCADLGVSLHTSTSGLDLPIKILDYFGCEVPVIAYSFSCLRELVQDQVNGRTFTTATSLSTILLDLLEPLTAAQQEREDGSVTNHDFGDLKRYSLQSQGRLLWSENWPKNAWPVLHEAVNKNRKAIEKYQQKKQTAAVTAEDPKSSKKTE